MAISTRLTHKRHGRLIGGTKNEIYSIILAPMPALLGLIFAGPIN
jgi:hypothetical protein